MRTRLSYLTVLLFFVFIADMIYAQSKRMDSLLTVLSTEKNDSEKVKTLYFLSRTSSKEEHYFDGIHYAQLSVRLADSLHYLAGSARGSTAEAIANSHLANFGEAIRCGLLALSQYTALGSITGMGDAENGLGNAYYDQKIYDKALEHYKEALKNYRMGTNKMKQAGAFNNVANAYNGLGEYRRSLEMYDSILVLQKQMKNEPGISDCYMSMGQSFTGLHQYDSALAYYRLALPYYESVRNVERMAYTYGCFGEAYSRKKDYLDARAWLTKGIAMKDEVFDKITLKEIYYTLAVADSALGDLESSYAHFSLYLDYKDSLTSDDDVRRQTQAELQYEFGKATAADSVRRSEELNREHIRQDEEVAQQRLYTIGGISGCALMLVAAIVSLTAYRQNRRRNFIIARQKEIVEVKQKEIMDSIHYAERIQRSLLPSEKYIAKKLSGLK